MILMGRTQVFPLFSFAMEAQYIDYKDTRCFSSAVIKYIQQDISLKPFYHQPPTLDGFSQLIKSKKPFTNRATLVEVLQEQYNTLPKTAPEVLKNINLLKQENSYTITTGHQLNIFTGPLYFIFKIVTAINLAKDLKKQFPEKEFVPVYWMASEDHDFEEINHTYLYDKKIIWEEKTQGATGRLNTSGIAKALAEYKGVLGISDYAEKLNQIIETTYLQYPKLADATRYLVDQLFGSYGLVILDADNASLKNQFKDIITEDIIHQNSFKNINQTIEELEKVNIHAQVNPREINFFYLLDNFRERIVFEEDVYKILNTNISFSEDELKNEIHLHPERFSPNVVMRPLYQEVILPNLAYVGGGAEVVYWLQLKSNFDFYKVDFPILILRNSAMLADHKVINKLQKLKLNFEEIFEKTHELKSEWVQKNTVHDLSLSDEWRELECVFARLKLKAHKIDPTLAPSAEAVKVRLERSINKLEKKLLKAEKKNYADALSDIDKIKDILFPKGGLQERRENFGSYYIKHGDNFIENLVKHFDPLAFKFTILH
jgi:bacillithiol biosynthesis cysteine-adding enzyme BshC